MAYLDRLIAVNNADLSRYWRFIVAKSPVGWVRPAFAQRLLAWPKYFCLDAEQQTLSLHPELDAATPQERTKAMAAVLLALREQGLIPGWRDEPYSVAARWSDPPLLTLERAAAVLFGITGYGVHVNGYLSANASQPLRMWVAQRAADRFVAPGKLDQLVAGGQPAHLGLWENVRKECWEEASIPEALTAALVPVGTINYCYETSRGLRPDVLFLFDLPLPEDFQPINTDGEVATFHCLSLEEVAQRVEQSDDFKFNCSLVVIDFLIRHGYLAPEHPDYVAITSGLRTRACFESGFGLAS